MPPFTPDAISIAAATLLFRRYFRHAAIDCRHADAAFRVTATLCRLILIRFR